MADRLDVIRPMEETVARLLAGAVVPPEPPAGGDAPLSGALPMLDEVTAPVERLLADADALARETDAALASAALALAGWRGKAHPAADPIS